MYPYRHLIDPLARSADISSVLGSLLQKGIDRSQSSLANVQLMNWKAGYTITLREERED
jgi:hypothetical protein